MVVVESMLVRVELQRHITDSRSSTDTARARLNNIYQELSTLPINAGSTILQSKLAPTDLHSPLTILYSQWLYSPFSHASFSILCLSPLKGPLEQYQDDRESKIGLDKIEKSYIRHGNLSIVRCAPTT